MAFRQRTNPEHCQEDKVAKCEAKGRAEKSPCKSAGAGRWFLRAQARLGKALWRDSQCESQMLSSVRRALKSLRVLSLSLLSKHPRDLEGWLFSIGMI